MGNICLKLFEFMQVVPENHLAEELAPMLCSTQLSMKFILLTNAKMPAIVGNLTFISMINTTSERLKARNFFNCQCFCFMSS